MEISILTPCYHPDACLQGCLESVRSQVEALAPLGVSLHHHVQDGGSGDDVLAFLREYRDRWEHRPLPGYRFTFHSEADQGMYDAMNRAYAVTQGEILGHLNTDEQYQPNALATAASWFISHSETDILSGSAIVTQKDGRYLCSRKAMLPSRAYTRLCQLTLFTAATFMRRRALSALGHYFDDSFRSAGDADLILRLLERGSVFAKVPDYMALFILTEENLSLSGIGAEEQLRFSPFSPGVTRCLRKGALPLFQLRKLFSGAYRLQPFSYTFWQGAAPEIHEVARPTGIWKHPAS